MQSELKHTKLYSEHKKIGAMMTNSAGWCMPLHYGSQMQEHLLVRKDCGVFDVSHQAVFDVTGNEASKYLAYILANNIYKLTSPGMVLYSCLLNEAGGIIDDLIVYYLSANHYRIVVNANMHNKVNEWLLLYSDSFAVKVEYLPTLCVIALQGPNSKEKLYKILSEQKRKLADSLTVFSCNYDGEYLIARIGCTGEEGFEIILPESDVKLLWQRCMEHKISPIGLGARDTLRLEAGYNMSGQDMDTNVNPFAANLGWSVSLEDERDDFIGKDSLLNLALHSGERLIGVLFNGMGMLHTGEKLLNGASKAGIITSGCYSPVLQRSIGLARVVQPLFGSYDIVIRGKTHELLVVNLPFVKNGVMSKNVTNLIGDTGT